MGLWGLLGGFLWLLGSLPEPPSVLGGFLGLLAVSWASLMEPSGSWAASRDGSWVASFPSVWGLALGSVA